MIDLTGKHIFIAGGSRGIGRANALMAARAGADVTINYVRDNSAAEAVVEEIKRLDRKAFAVQADIAKEGEADRALKTALEQLGPIRGLAISAGIFEGTPIDQMTAEFWDRTMSINLRGTFLAVRAAVPYLRNAKGGSIVIYTSTAGQRGSSVYSAYATSKGAQLLFMRSMAKELAPDRIRVNCVAPGWTETDMSREAMDAEGRDGIIASIPLGRIGKPEDPAAAACFLLSDLAQFITGSTFNVDGGFVWLG
jgi:NAD(P)-dependent dehydrogenase (short-subunit alcohol dehydrogenase family)